MMTIVIKHDSRITFPTTLFSFSFFKKKKTESKIKSYQPRRKKKEKKRKEKTLCIDNLFIYFKKTGVTQMEKERLTER